MTIKNIIAILALSAASPIAPSTGQDVISDFGNVTTEPLAFSSDFAAAPTGTAFLSDFAADTFSRADNVETYGRYKIRLDSSAGTHSRGTMIVVMRDGFESDFVQMTDPQMPAEYLNVVVSSNFAEDRHAAETYPPPAALDCDFSSAGLSFSSRFFDGTHRKATGDTTYGRYQLSDGDVILSGRPIQGSRPFVVEQMLPGSAADDRLGYFRLGETTLGGAAV